MSSKNKDYIVTRGNYTVKKRHKLLNDSTIYERDYMTVGTEGGWRNDSLPYGTSNFKLTRRSEQNGTRKHKFGDWEVFDGSTVATLDSVSSVESSESSIKLHQFSKSLSDYAYYGSCSDLVKYSISKIVEQFPGELYVTDKQCRIYNGDDAYLLGKEEFDVPVMIYNPFEINISAESMNESDVYNKMRYFCLSRHLYDVIDYNGDMVYCSPKWESDTKDKICFDEGDRIATVYLEDEMMICEYYYNGGTVLLTDGKYIGYHIRPKERLLEEFFNGLTPFESVLLNRTTTPLYTATFEYMYDDENGYHYQDRKYTWPSSYGWNIEVNNAAFENYLSSLMELAQVYDESFSDNLWRMMVHDSVKNMDLTFTNNMDDTDSEDYALGTTKFKMLMSGYAYIFDELKTYIDNISNTNVITYNKENNLPDYFLSDAVSMSGWDVVNAVSTFANSGSEIRLYQSDNHRYTASEANTIFLRNLKLNSKAILSRKGTKEAIEMVLGLFGYMSDDFARNLPTPQDGDYSINEYVAVASMNEIVPVDDTLSTQKYGLLVNGEDLYSDDPLELGLDGLPVRVVVFENEKGSFKYLIPWFTNPSSSSNGDEMYFQMYGGWGKTYKKYINEGILAQGINSIISDGKFTIYDETHKYLNVVRDINELFAVPYGQLQNGDIYYVYDNSTLSMYEENTQSGDLSKYSNYFIINDREYCTEYSENGWKCITSDEIENAYGNGVKVLYLESIIDDTTGNNPHVGYGKYDDGQEYLLRFKQLFREAIINNNFLDDAYKCENGELIDGIKEHGFTVSDLIEDNVKTWYFTDHYKRHNNLQRIDYYNIDNLEDAYGPILQYDITTSTENKVGKNTDTFYKSDLVPYNFETGIHGDNDANPNSSNDEAAANSIINVKNLKITFKGSIAKESGFREYLYKCIMPYLKQVVPSTSLLEIEIENESVEYGCQEDLPIEGVINTNDNTDTFDKLEFSDSVTLNIDADVDQFTYKMSAPLKWTITNP